MAYKFKLGAAIRIEFQRIGLEQIERAERVLVRSGDHDSTIHDTRKCLKRIRALLRLVRPGLTRKDYEHANALFRQLGALLSEARDNHIMLQTIAKLEAYGARVPLQGLKQLIFTQHDCERSGMDPGLTAAAVAGLRQARMHFEILPIANPGFKVLRRGLERSYAHGRRAVAKAYAEPGDEAFHDLRKGAQLHWRHMKLLERAWPDYCGARISAARELSQILGDDHDLAVLKLFLKQVPHEQIGPAEARVIRRAIAARQNELRESAYPRARRLFAERPEDLGRQMDVLWSSAKSLRDVTSGDTSGAKSRKEAAPRLDPGKRQPAIPASAAE